MSINTNTSIRSGRTVVGSWNPQTQTVAQLRDLLAEIDASPEQQGCEINMGELPTVEFPEAVNQYPVWAVDYQGNALVGPAARDIEPIAKVLDGYAEKFDRRSLRGNGIFKVLFPTYKAEILVTTPGRPENTVEEHTALVEFSPHDDDFDSLLRDMESGEITITEASEWWKEHAKARFDVECEVQSLAGIEEYQAWLGLAGEEIFGLDFVDETARMQRYVESRKATA